MKKIKRFASSMMAVILAGTLTVGSLSVAAFGAEDVGSVESTSVETSFEEATEEVETGVSDSAVSDTSEIAAEEAAVTSYTVTLDANGGYFANEMDDILNETLEKTEILNKIVPVGGIVSTVPLYEQEGITATFLGWSLERNGEILPQEQEGYAPVRDCVLYAVWKYEDAADTADTSVTTGEDVPEEVLNDPIETEEPEASVPEEEITQEKNDSEDVLIDETAAEETADEEPATYAVTLDANGGYFVNEWDDVLGEYVEQAEVVTKYIPVGGTINVVPVTDQKDGVGTFLGWSLERDGKMLVSQGLEEYSPVDNCVLYAVWQIEEVQKEREETDVKGLDKAKEDSEDISIEDQKDTVSVVEETDDVKKNQEQPASENSKQDERLIEIIADGKDESVRTNAAMTLVDSGTCGDNLTWTLDEKGTLTISGTGEMSSASYNRGWHLYMTSIKSVIIEDGVSSIGDNAFQDCSSIENVIIPESVTSIGKQSFSNCIKLTEIYIPPYVTSIGKDAFYYCIGLRSIEIPPSVISIGDDAFGYCKSLYLITVPSVVASTYNCYKRIFSELKEVELVFSSDVETIYKENFKECNELKKVTFPRHMERIGDSAFQSCKNLEEIVFPESINEIGEYAFSNCDLLNFKSEDLPREIDKMEKGTFMGCKSVEGPIIVCWNVGVSSFNSCSNIKKIEIAKGVTSIEDNAFIGCTSLEEIIVPDSVETVGEAAFKGCTGIKRMTIPQCIVDDFRNVFKDTMLKDVEMNLSTNVKEIKDDTFYRKNIFSKITTTPNLTSIGNRAFYECTSLKEFVFSTGLTDIGD